MFLHFKIAEDADNMQSIFGLSQSQTSISKSQNKDQQSNGSHVYLAYHNGECMITRKFALENDRKGD